MHDFSIHAALGIVRNAGVMRVSAAYGSSGLPSHLWRRSLDQRKPFIRVRQPSNRGGICAPVKRERTRNFPRVIARYVREKHVLTLEDAIRKMTSWPATRMRIAERGVIRDGMWADAVVFDYDKIQDRSTYATPDLTPDGIDYALVNGQVVIDHGRHTGARPGKIIYVQATKISPATTVRAAVAIL
jgi:hypothetical protein